MAKKLFWPLWTFCLLTALVITFFVLSGAKNQMFSFFSTGTMLLLAAMIFTLWKSIIWFMEAKYKASFLLLGLLAVPGFIMFCFIVYFSFHPFHWQ